MSEIVGGILKFIIEIIIRMIVYFIIELIVMAIAEVVKSFFGRTGWFSVLYLSMAGLAGYQIFTSLRVAENANSEFYGIAATIVVLAIAPFIHPRIEAFVEAIKQSRAAEKSKPELEL